MENKQINGRKVIKAIIENYRETEKSLVAQLNFEVPDHPPTIGGFREEIWKQFFEQIVPKKYVIEQSVFLLDSSGNVSNEVDLAILDEMYTPYIFRKGRIKFIPIEAVAAVVQCKSTNVDTGDLINWYESIHKLKTSRKSIARMHGYIATDKLDCNKNTKITQSGTRPIFILCCLKKPSEKVIEEFDFTVCTIKNEGKINVTTNKKNTKLSEWFNSLNHSEGREYVKEEYKNNGTGFDDENDKSLDKYKVTDGQENEISLLSFNFQLNQLLMLINNPMLFPHIAYVTMFNNANKENGDDGKETDCHN